MSFPKSCANIFSEVNKIIFAFFIQWRCELGDRAISGPSVPCT